MRLRNKWEQFEITRVFPAQNKMHSCSVRVERCEFWSLWMRESQCMRVSEISFRYSHFFTQDLLGEFYDLIVSYPLLIVIIPWSKLTCYSLYQTFITTCGHRVLVTRLLSQGSKFYNLSMVIYHIETCTCCTKRICQLFRCDKLINVSEADKSQGKQSLKTGAW